MRPFDVVGRWGGEEFLVILPNIAENDLPGAAERLRILVAGAYLTVDDDHLAVTVTGGGATYRRGDSLEELLSRADDRLYQGKAAGRDQVITSDSDVETASPS